MMSADEPKLKTAKKMGLGIFLPFKIRVIEGGVNYHV